MKKISCCYLSLFLAFILGSHNGFVAVLSDDSPDPVAVFPYRTTSLPPADRAALEQGIPIESAEQLHRLIEDYLS